MDPKLIFFDKTQIFILKKRFAKLSCEFFVLATKLTITTGYGTYSAAILVIEDWILSDPDPKLIIPDP